MRPEAAVAASGVTVSIRKAQMRDLRTDLDLTGEELRYALELARDVKRDPGAYTHALAGRYLALLFEKPSLRTRLTFELAIKQLGGDCVSTNGPVADREPVRDVARNLERWTAGIVARVFSQNTIEELAAWSRVPVINALSDLYHPCQALADMLTLYERFGRCDGVRLAFTGDGNNVAHSLMLCAARLGMDIRVATPPGFEPRPHVAAQAAELAQHSGARILVTHDPFEAVDGADAVYTDVWASMGQEGEADERRRVFRKYQVNEELMAAAGTALFMHCLPAKRGEELTDAVAESVNSVMFDQAENRLHAQKALLLMLLE
jgi:ornithine carbamoyltransferase